MGIIDVEKIKFEFGANLVIIDGISFSVEKQEFVTLVGPSGCGKSTLLRIIAGLIKPNSGSVYFMGRKITEPTTGISFVFQDFGLLPWLTAMENVKLGMSMLGISEYEKEKRAAELLEKFGLSSFANAYINSLSGGMKQRVGIARALSSDPKVLLMDEPFSSIDELTAESLRSDVLSTLKNPETPVDSVIMVSHNIEEAVELSDRIIVLSDKPSKVKGIKSISLPYPRNKHDKRFMQNVDEIYSILTG
ncbi:MAG: ABC transporter ATP-binding protein [Candidatus Micrarchaeaceae archaeon]